MKIQATDWEKKSFSNHVSNKYLVSGVCKELLQLSSRKKIPIKKWAKVLNGVSPQKCMNSRHEVRGLRVFVLSIIDRGRKPGKASVRFRLIPAGWLPLGTARCGQGVARRESVSPVGICCAHRAHCGSFLELTGSRHRGRRSPRGHEGMWPPLGLEGLL